MISGAIVILAAGESSRLGRPKQLLAFGGKTLIAQSVDEALKAGLLTIVVTGANAEQVSAAIANRDIVIVHNRDWPSGMASGIKAGVEKALEMALELQCIITTVCDQPFVSAALFNSLYNEQAKTGKGIVGCAYAGTTGTPVLFTQNYFLHLLNLGGDRGAKGLLKKFADDVATIPFEQGAVDIDTEKDYRQLLSSQGS